MYARPCVLVFPAALDLFGDHIDLSGKDEAVVFGPYLFRKKSETVRQIIARLKLHTLLFFRKLGLNRLALSYMFDRRFQVRIIVLIE